MGLLVYAVVRPYVRAWLAVSRLVRHTDGRGVRVGGQRRSHRQGSMRLYRLSVLRNARGYQVGRGLAE
jgi:hypothetical protein